MARAAEEPINELLGGAVEDLDLPRPLENTIRGIYDDVGAWMANTLGEGDWSIYSQGSGRLGTMVRRVDGGDYDIDSVVQWNVDKTSTTQRKLKAKVGETLDAYVKARASDPGVVPTGCDEGRRCFTLTFDEPVHMDVLPAVPDRDWQPTGIWIPDRDLWAWQPSDPIGYADWFHAQAGDEFRERRADLAFTASVDVEEVPAWWVRTTLQRTVQVFKAHRNNSFDDDDPARPSSIVITTLAAKAYRKEHQLVEAVMNTAAMMPKLIDRDGLKYVVLNPARETENFADLWTPATANRFFAWIDDVQQTLEQALTVRNGIQGAAAVLEPKFGAGPVQRAVARFATAHREARTHGRLAVATSGVLGTAGVKVRDHTFHGD